MGQCTLWTHSTGTPTLDGRPWRTVNHTSTLRPKPGLQELRGTLPEGTAGRPSEGSDRGEGVVFHPFSEKGGSRVRVGGGRAAW